MAITELYDIKTASLEQQGYIPSIEHGPLPEADHLSAGLDLYKFTMSQFAYEYERDAEVTFDFKNRSGQVLKDHIDPEALQARFDYLRERGFSDKELGYLKTIKGKDGEALFSDDYVSYLATSELPEVHVSVEDDIKVTTTGAWPLVTFWETVVMSEINESYFEGYIRDNNIDLTDLYREGDKRLSEKIAYLQENPDIKLMEFGTRRRFSLRWQKHVIERLKNECPENLIGTSNPAFAASEGLEAKGTFAHELLMVYAGLADARGKNIRASHGQVLDNWRELYGENLSIALTDTFGSDFFFEDFGKKRAELWDGTRHDSGDPIVYGKKVLQFYQRHGVDPTAKSILFSDGLNMAKIDTIHKYFKGLINHAFGVGTDLTNDLGLPAVNGVMKATFVNGKENVKLSDDEGKETGSEKQVRRYKRIFKTKTGKAIIAALMR